MEILCEHGQIDIHTPPVPALLYCVGRPIRLTQHQGQLTHYGVGTYVGFRVPILYPNNQTGIVGSPLFLHVQCLIQIMTVARVEKKLQVSLPYNVFLTTRSGGATIWPTRKSHMYACGFLQQSKPHPPPRPFQVRKIVQRGRLKPFPTCAVAMI